MHYRQLHDLCSPAARSMQVVILNIAVSSIPVTVAMVSERQTTRSVCVCKGSAEGRQFRRYSHLLPC